MSDTVGGRNPAAVEVGTSSHYVLGFIYPRWLFGISSTTSTKTDVDAVDPVDYR